VVRAQSSQSEPQFGLVSACMGVWCHLPSVWLLQLCAALALGGVAVLSAVRQRRQAGRCRDGLKTHRCRPASGPIQHSHPLHPPFHTHTLHACTRPATSVGASSPSTPHATNVLH
jgi:hypothetical protein